MIKFRCECGKRYEVSDGLAGKTAKCKACRSALTVPQVADSESDEQFSISTRVRSNNPEPTQDSWPAVPARSSGVTTSVAFGRLLNQNVFESFAKQVALTRQHEEQNWGYNAETGALTFEADEVSYPADVLGMEDLENGIWIWAWDDPKNDWPDSQLESALMLQNFGIENNVPELMDGRHSLENISGTDVAMIACGMCDGKAYWPIGEPEKFQLMLMLKEPSAVIQQTTDPLMILSTIGQAISTLEVSDMREATAMYLKRNGYELISKNPLVAGRNGQQELQFEFDDMNRLSSMKTTG